MTKTPLALALLAGFATPPVCAAPPTGAGSAVTLGKVDVRHGGNNALTANQVFTSVDVMGGDQVETKNVGASWELLGQMPGMQLTETRQGAESGKVTFRAFNGEGYLNGIKTLIDGVPSNVNSGNQRFIDMIFPLEVAYIEVVRGTNDPRYGLHNIGGNINLATRQGGHYTDTRLSVGSFDTHQLQFAMGRERDGFAQNYFVGTQDSNGYRDHDQSRKHTLAGKWFWGTAEDVAQFGITARTYTQRAEEPGFMTAEELATNRRGSQRRNAHDISDRDMQQLSTRLDLHLADTVHVANTLYYNRYEDDRRVTFSDYPVGNAPRQRRQWDETQTGWMSTVTWAARPAFTLEGGFNAEHQDNGYRRLRYGYSEPTDFTAPPARVQNDERYHLDNLGAYVQAVITPLPSLRVVPAYRVDRFDGRTRLMDGSTAPLQHYGSIGQPKLSVVYTLSPAWNLYANWGRTFQVLTGSTAPAYLQPGQPTYRPSLNTGKEAGLKYSPHAGLQARLALWQQDATDEMANMPATGTVLALGQTRRRGVDLQVNATVGERWTLWASHAYQEARVVRLEDEQGRSLAGKEVFSTPRHISNIGARLQASERWTVELQGRMQGDYYIDARNEAGKYGGFAVLDLSTGYQLSDSLSVDLQVKNLTGREYVYAWYDTFFWGSQARPMFSPSSGRSVFVSLTLKH